MLILGSTEKKLILDNFTSAETPQTAIFESCSKAVQTFFSRPIFSRPILFPSKHRTHRATDQLPRLRSRTLVSTTGESCRPRLGLHVPSLGIRGMEFAHLKGNRNLIRLEVAAGDESTSKRRPISSAARWSRPCPQFQSSHQTSVSAGRRAPPDRQTVFLLFIKIPCSSVNKQTAHSLIRPRTVPHSLRDPSR